MQTYIMLLLINLFVMLVHESGFFEYWDDKISNKYRFHHLPKILICANCQTFWISVLYILITPGAFTAINLVLCVLNYHLLDITQGIWRIMKKGIMDLLGVIDDVL